MSSHLSNGGLFTRISKYYQIKRNRHRENENLVEFSIQLQLQTGSPVYKIAKEISQNSGSLDSPTAPTDFFLRYCESECLWLLNSPETGKKVCLEKIHQSRKRESHLKII